MGPILLAADNFTPLTRTPWAGIKIGKLYKSDLVPGASGKRIGESWEFSCDPAFPSRLADGSGSLAQLIPDAQILVKLLDTADALSLQVHPRDDDPHLSPGECGKPESWLILDAEPDAGIYLGFERPVTRAELASLLRDGTAAAEALHFVPVRPGDYFEIEPGVPHCIGKGVTLLEPQRIVPGLSGKTYRLFDFGRKYDAEGRLDLRSGTPRALHLEQGLSLLDPASQIGEAFARSLMRHPHVESHGTGVSVRRFPPNPYYQVTVIEAKKGASCRFEIAGGYGALVVLKGRFAVAGQVLARGQPALLPDQGQPMTLTAEADFQAVLTVPAQARLSFAR